MERDTVQYSDIVFTGVSPRRAAVSYTAISYINSTQGHTSSLRWSPDPGDMKVATLHCNDV